MSCYLFGLVNTILYAWIAWDARYLGEVMLNVVYYVPMQFAGWFMWKKHRNQETGEVVKTRLSLKGDLAAAGIAAASIYGYGLILKALGGNLPFTDSLSTCLSAGYAVQRKASDGAVDTLDCGGCGNRIYVGGGLCKRGNGYRYAPYVVRLSVECRNYAS